jgi:chemotaxis protein CheC
MKGSRHIPETALARFRALSEESLRRAAESLSGLLGHPVRLTVSSIGVVPVGALPGLTAEAVSGPMAGLRVRFSGDAAGQIVILFLLATVFRMLGSLVGGGAGLRSLSEMDRSAVQEVGNILASSFLSGLADLLGKRLMLAPPELHVEDLPALIPRVMAEFEGKGPEVLVVEAHFEDPGQRIEGRFYVLPEAASLNALLQAAPGDGGR